jgi:hypothetical protein
VLPAQAIQDSSTTPSLRIVQVTPFGEAGWSWQLWMQDGRVVDDQARTCKDAKDLAAELAPYVLVAPVPTGAYGLDP